MLNQIVNLVKEQAMSQFINQTDVPNEQAEVAAQAAGASIFETITSQISSGNIAGITNLLTGGNSQINVSNPIIQNVMNTLARKLMGNGISQDTAQSASSSVIPNLMEQVIGKFTSPAKKDAAFDTESLISSVVNSSIQDAVKNQVSKNLGNVLGGFFK